LCCWKGRSGSGRGATIHIIIVFALVVVDLEVEEEQWFILLNWICVRNKTLTLIEREDDTRSWINFLVYFSHFTTMPCPPRGWRYILIGC
jgi:hypothetical protein